MAERLCIEMRKGFKRKGKLTTLAVACRRPAGCSEWNMSQSGCTKTPMNRLLYAFTATCVVWEAGSLGQKSSEDLAMTVFSILQKQSRSLAHDHSEEVPISA